MKTPELLKKHWPVFVCIALLAIPITLHFAKSRSQPSSAKIQIGVILSLTGENANYGNRSLHGIQWAAEKLNAKGGIGGMPVEILLADCKSNPKEAVTAYQQLKSKSKIHVIVGDILSGTTLAIAPLAERDKILLLAPGASNPKLTNAGDYIFRNWTSDDFDGRGMASYIKNSGDRKCGILIEKTDYTMGIANAFIDEFSKNQGQVVAKIEFDSKALDFRDAIEKIRVEQPPVVYIAAYSAATGRILKQFAEAQVEARLFCTLTADTPECRSLAGKAIEGVTFSTPGVDLTSKSPHIVQFTEGFEERFKDKPEETAAHAYDAIMILASIWPEDTSNSIAESLRDRLYQIKNYPGVSGTTTMDSNGDVIKPIFIKRFENGTPILVKTIEPH